MGEQVETKNRLPAVVLRGEVLLSGASLLICIGFALWVIFKWSGYSDGYTQRMDGWRLGGTHLVELTVVAEDRARLACASDGHFGPIRCGFNARKKARKTPEQELLSPYSTTDGKLLLAAGLWTSKALQELPRKRVTVVCNFHVVGVLKSVRLRWKDKGPFERVRHGLVSGTLEDCAIPQ
jgi:hypothetical protein